MHHIRQRAGEALTHVRHFSSKVKNEKPEEPWVRSLDEHVQWEIKEEFEGRRLFRQSTDQTIRLYRDGSPTKEILSSSTEFTESDELKEITKELETTWKDAIKHLIKKREGKSNDLAELINDPTPKRLEAMVRRAAREVEAKAHTTGGKMRAEFRKLVARIENHKYLLDMLPSGDMYTSVLIGGFTACIKTTLEHEEIAGLISDCLEKLSDKTHKLYRAIRNPDRNEYIRAHIMKFYSTLFGLLVTILDRWLLSTAQRWKNSFGSSFQNQLRRSIDGLDYHVKELTDENSSLILQGVSNQVSQLGPMLQALLAGGIIDSSTGVYSGIPLTPKKTSASSMTPFAASQATLDSVSSLAASVASSMQDEQNDDYWTSQTILEDTAWMKEYVCSKREQYLLERSRYGSTDPQVYSRLLRWTQSSSSEALWLEGPSTMGDMTPNTLITACIVETFRRLDVPIISYFCHYDPRYYSTFSRPQELLKMVYSLTSQMLAFIPKDLSSALDAEDLPDFSPARIQRLSSDSGSLPDAIDFLRDIIPLAPPVLACCVDGLQILDSRDESRWYRDCLKSFIEVLGTTKPPEPRIMKLWLSTDGHSLTLQDAVNAGWIESDITNGEDDTEPLTIEQWM